jgi:hypothetical protein
MSSFFSLFQSTDGMHHVLKRSYPELREAVSEVGFGAATDSMMQFETATNVSTAVGGPDMSPSMVSAVAASTVRKGLMWQQRDKIFSRWKERFFILTHDYLQCFKRGTSRITEMGAFIFKLKLIEVSRWSGLL